VNLCARWWQQLRLAVRKGCDSQRRVSEWGRDRARRGTVLAHRYYFGILPFAVIAMIHEVKARSHSSSRLKVVTVAPRAIGVMTVGLVAELRCKVSFWWIAR
jgi:hypothetical protein